MTERRILQDVVSEKSVPLRVGAESATPKSAFLSRERRDERRERMLSSNFGTEPTPKKRGWSWLIALLIPVIIIIILIVATRLASANVTINPIHKTFAIDASFHVTKDSTTGAGLPTFSILEATSTDSIQVPAGASKYVERKATGKVTTYNEYSKSSVRLLSNTRFQSPDGKIFRTYSAVLIPGYRMNGSKIIPGSVDVSVTAGEAGDSYNIGPTTFVLPGLKNSVDMYNKVYARSVQAMTGGLTGEVKSVSDQDLTKARSTLTGSLTQKLLDNVKNNIPDDMIFLSGGYVLNFDFNEYGQTPSDENMQAVQMNGTISSLIFNKNELSNFLAKRYISDLGDASVDIGNWPDLTLEIGSPDLVNTANEITVHIAGSAQFIWHFDQDKLRSELVGVKKSDYSKVFLNYPSIDTAEVRFSPFWISSFPSKASRIDIKTVLR